MMEMLQSSWYRVERKEIIQRMLQLDRAYFPGRWLEIRPSAFHQSPMTADEYVLFRAASEHLIAMGTKDWMFQIVGFWLEQTRPNVQPNETLRTMIWFYLIELAGKLPKQSPVRGFFLDYVELDFFVHGDPLFLKVFAGLLTETNLDEVWCSNMTARIHAALRARLMLETTPLRRRVIWETLLQTMMPAMVPGFMSTFAACLHEDLDGKGVCAVHDVLAVTTIMKEMMEKDKENKQPGRRWNMVDILIPLTKILIRHFSLNQRQSQRDECQPSQPPGYIIWYHVLEHLSAPDAFFPRVMESLSHPESCFPAEHEELRREWNKLLSQSRAWFRRRLE